MTMTVPLTTRDALAALERAGVRHEVVDAGADWTVLRFFHSDLDDLARAIDEGGATAEKLRNQLDEVQDRYDECKYELREEATERRRLSLLLQEIRKAVAA